MTPQIPRVRRPEHTNQHRAAPCVAGGAGLQVRPIASLKVGDIDSERMLIRVERGKDGKCRHALL
jgi:integrase/recombinase XerD